MNNENVITEVVDIPVIKKSYLEKAIEKLNRKAVKIGCKPMSLIFDNEHVIDGEKNPITGVKVKIEMVTATLNYIIPIIEGYELLAKLDIYTTTSGDSEVMVSAVPDKFIPEKYKTATSIQCDHCGWKRNRKHSILLQHENGEYKEVGSTCVKDFFGLDPRGFMMMASINFEDIVGSIDDDKVFGDAGGGVWAYETEDVLSFAAASVVKWGWLSKGKAWELNRDHNGQGKYYVSTAAHVSENLNPYHKMPEADKVDVITEDVELAKKTIEYFTNLDPKGNDYLINCCKLIRIGYVPGKHLGIACSMITAYQRGVVKEEERAAKQSKEDAMPDSEFQGEIKERLRGIQVTVTYKRHFENDFGGTTLYSFIDHLGNIYKTFYSGYGWDCEINDVVVIDGTVKKHNEYNNKKETMLNHVAVTEVTTEDVFKADEFAVA